MYLPTHIVCPVSVPVGDYINYTSVACFGNQIESSKANVQYNKEIYLSI